MLKALLAARPAGALRVVAVTERDLFVPVLSFVYGQAQLEGPVAVVSLARLRPEFHGLAPDEPTLARRAATEAVHEIGHIFGLGHSEDQRDLMGAYRGPARDDFSDREITVMSLMMHRRGGNAWPDNDRSATSSGVQRHVILN